MRATAHLNELLRQLIPKGQRFRVSLEPTGVGKYQVLRIVTPAWRSLPRFERILKVHKAMAHLSEKETNNILRVSVLTAEEYRRLRKNLGPRRAIRGKSRRRAANGK